MLSSWQIAAMHEQQGQMLMPGGVQQLSAPPPAPYGSYGGAAGPGPMSALLSGSGGRFGAGPGPGFSYGAGRNNNTAFGNFGVAAVGGLGQSYSQGLGMSGAMMGFSAGGGFAALGKGAFGSVLGGSLVGAGIGMGVGAVGSHVFGSMVSGAQEQQVLERTLSQFRFSNTASRTGQGFSRQDQRAIGDMVRQMERVPEMLTSFGELNRVMDKMGQMGLMQGVRDVTQFNEKFKSTVSTLKDLAKMMGTTMEGALQAFGEARQSGFYSNQDIMRNVLNRQVTGAVTGMSQEQVAATQQYGAESSHARGGSRRGGAKAITRTANQFGMMNQMGLLTNDQIMEMTGKEGAEGIQELSGQMNDLAYKMARSGVGTATALALGEQKDGRYTGRIDEELAERYRSGGLSKGELLSMAHRKANSTGAKLSFAAHRDRLTTEMANSVGAEGLGMELQRLLGDRGWRNPDATNLVMQRFHASEEQANLMQQMMPNLQDIGMRLSQQRREQGMMAARNTVMQPMSWDAIKHRISKRIEHATTDWAKDLGVGIRDYFTNWADEFMDDMTGTYRREITQRSLNIMQSAMRGNKSSRQYVGSMIQSSAQNLAKGYQYQAPTGLSSIAESLLEFGGERSAGARFVAQEQALNGNRYLKEVGGGYAMDRGAQEARIGASLFATGTAHTRKAQMQLTTQGSQDLGAITEQLRLLSSRRDIASEQDPAEKTRKLVEGMQSPLAGTAYASKGVDPTVRMAEIDKKLAEIEPQTTRQTGMSGTYRDMKTQLLQEKAALAMSRSGLSPEQGLEVGRANLTGRADLPSSSERLGGFRATVNQMPYQERSKAIRERKDKLRSALGTGDEYTAGYSEVIEAGRAGTKVGQLLTGMPGEEGLLFQDPNKEKYDFLGAGEFTPEMRSYLKDKHEWSSEEVTKFEQDKQGRHKLGAARDKLRASGNLLTAKELLELDSKEAFDAVTQQYAAYGRSLTETSKSGSAKFLSRKTKGKTDDLMKKMGGLAQTYESFQGATQESIGGIMDKINKQKGDIYETYAGLGTEDRAAFDRYAKETGQEEISSKGNYYRQLNERTKKARKSKKGMGFLDFTGGDERTLFGGDTAKQEYAMALTDPAGYAKHAMYKSLSQTEEGRDALKASGMKDSDIRVEGSGIDRLNKELKNYSGTDVGKKAGTQVEGGVDPKKVQELFESLTKTNNATADVLKELAGKIGAAP